MWHVWERREKCARFWWRKETTRKTRRRWEDGIRMDLRETGWGDWIRLAQDRDRWLAVVNAAMNLQFFPPRS
jgi:hypothetical protein